jgi:hypothetical protein
MAVVINPRDSKIVAAATLRLQQHVLQTAKNQLARHQSSGRFPKEKSGYFTFLRQNGRTIKRDFDKIPARYLTFPNAISFVRNQEETFISDVIYQWLALYNQRAPIGERAKLHSYKYKQSLVFFINNNEVTPEGMRAILQRGVPKGSIIRIINFAPHASTVEDNWNRKGPMPGGVMYHVTRAIARANIDVSVAYSYILSDQLGLRYGYRTGGPSKGSPVPYFLPMVEFGGPGLFSRRFVGPGNNRTRRRSTRNRRGKF